MKNTLKNNLPTPIPFQKKGHRNLNLELAAPDIAVAFHDEDTPGLIPVTEVPQPLIVDLKVWPAARPDYTYQLLFDNHKTGPEKLILASHAPGDALTLEIPPELLLEGFHEVAYLVTNPINNVSQPSEVFRIQIDKTAPGAPELAAIQFPTDIQNGLTAAELDQLGGQLDVQIAGYTGMAKHDRILTRWGDIAGPSAVVNETDMGLDRVVVTFTKEFLRTLGEDEKLVCYQVIDRAGNPSMLSNTEPVKLKLQELPSNYPAPVIDRTVGSQVDYLEAQAGVVVDIPHYPGAAALDNIQLFWGINNPLTPVPVAVGDENDAVVLALKLPFEAIARGPQGNTTVHYEVIRDGELAGTSLDTRIDVFTTLPLAEPLEHLTVQGSSVQNPNTQDNFIDEDDYELNGRGLIRWNAGFEVNDDLNLHWGNQITPQWYQLKSSDVLSGRDLIIPIDNEIMKLQGTGASIPVYFTATRTGNPNAVTSPTQSVTVRSREDQPGGQDGLMGPSFNLTSNGVLGPNENPNGANVKVSPYANIAEGQRITFTFKGFDDFNNPIEAATYVTTRKLDEIDVLQGHTFTVPLLNTLLICTGFAEATYTVEPVEGSNQSQANSTTTRVIVHMLRPSDLTCLAR
ncbi:hypothetical protein BW686_15485 [Pseudomonas syringae]|uniref:Uncharacterized protein n=1 Tax=Pseudomonas syringae TaxID=317 RepID=A0A244EPN1_PSESX|nr:hypothetical protein [Pseudomonas syringae]OUM06499.1 hypothetical protein BW686_15485 [Pseudomonas syringae]